MNRLDLDLRIWGFLILGFSCLHGFNYMRRLYVVSKIAKRGLMSDAKVVNVFVNALIIQRA